MSEQNENIEALIEHYLDGELTPEESADFRNRLNHNPDLARQVDLHKEVRAGIKYYGEREDLRNSLQAFHQEMVAETEAEKPKVEAKSTESAKGASRTGKVVPLRTVYRITGIAAAIALLVAASVTFMMNRNSDQSFAVAEITQTNNSTPVDKQELIDQIVDILREDSAFMRNGGAVMPRQVEKGTAFVVSRNGYLISNSHVTKGSSSKVFLNLPGDSSDIDLVARVVAVNDTLDLALLKITDARFEGFGRLPYTFNKSGARLGEEVYTLGYPTQELVYGEGAIAALNGYNDTIDYQISVPLNPGNSGGPLVNEKGEVLGVITARHNLLIGASYATKTEHFMRFVAPYLEAEGDEKVTLPSRNNLRGRKRPDQIDRMQPYVFQVITAY